MPRLFIVLTRNPLGLLGVALTTASAMLILVLIGLEATGFHGNPYVGILAYLVLPGCFLGGLVLIPIGLLWDRIRARRAHAQGRVPTAFPVIDLNRNQTRRLLLSFLLLTMVNVMILSAATYKGVEVMESTEFCGQTCHSVMSPEYTAYQDSPHSRVKCVACHIGPGADWFVKSKLSGAWQVVSVNLDLYQRPIPTPIHHLRPARETCEQCHWPSKFVGDRLWVKTHYSSDEANTELKTVLLLRVGGVEGRVSQGIHWHVDPAIQIRYRSDEKRETITDVELTEADGTVKVFTTGAEPTQAAAGSPAPSDAAAGPWRVMDCVDCHNRPSHTFSMPETEIDRALQAGKLDPSLPYLRREGLRTLREDYDSHATARQQIKAALRSFYAESHPGVEPERVDQAATDLANIYSRNVFPAMKVAWGSYPNHLGHTDFPGCFRCHDDEHTTPDGETISQDCSTCHTLLAMEEENPEILEMLQP
jgi:nitrate/TMAO reductase-like tetraheme cytochrome c subunit